MQHSYRDPPPNLSQLRNELEQLQESLPMLLAKNLAKTKDSLQNEADIEACMHSLRAIYTSFAEVSAALNDCPAPAIEDSNPVVTSQPPDQKNADYQEQEPMPKKRTRQKTDKGMEYAILRLGQKSCPSKAIVLDMVVELVSAYGVERSRASIISRLSNLRDYGYLQQGGSHDSRTTEPGAQRIQALLRQISPLQRRTADKAVEKVFNEAIDL